MPPLPDGIRFMAAAVVLWFTILALLRLVPAAGSWNYLYAAGGVVCNVLMVTGIVRLIRWARRRRGA
jgi:hypothetical protein